MGNTYSNVGPAITAGCTKDVTINQYNNVTVPTNAIVSSIVPPTKISFKPIPEPHGSFIGRVGYVNSAIAYLSHPVDSNVQIQFPCMVIHALGGYGKTQTARRIASICRKERKFQHFIWIDSESDISIKTDFVAVRKQIGLATPDETYQSPNFDSFMHQFYDHLLSCKNEKFLIIFDNVEDFDLVLEYLPLNYPASNIAVLITSQRPFTRESYGKVNNQRLDLLEEGEAIQLVENVLGRSSMESEQDNKLLVERSGRITLLLCVMTKTIKYHRKYQRDYRIKDYLEEMSDQPAQYSDESNALDLSYDKSLQKIVRFAVVKLIGVGGPIGQITAKIFDRLAYCPSTNKLTDRFVDKYLWDVREEVKNVDMKLPIKPVDDLQIIRMAIEKLSEFSLVELGDFVEFSVHRWIQASRRLDLKESGDERRVLKELLVTVPRMGFADRYSIGKHAAAYVDLVNEFQAKIEHFGN